MRKALILLCCSVLLLVGCSENNTEANNGFGISREDFMQELQSDGLLEWDYEGESEAGNENETTHMYSLGDALGVLVLSISENDEDEMTQILLVSDVDKVANYLIASGKIAEIVISDVELVSFVEKYKIAETEHEEVSGKEGNISVTSGIMDDKKLILFQSE